MRILLTAAPGWVAGAIRFVTGSRASHAGLQVGPDRVIHADQGGVRDDTLAGFLAGGRRIVAAFELQPAIAQLGDLRAILALVGRPYDYDGMAWALVPVLAWRWFRVRLRNPLADAGEFWCSELALTGLRAFLGPAHLPRVPELARLDAETLTPGGLQRALARCRAFTRVPAPECPPR